MNSLIFLFKRQFILKKIIYIFLTIIYLLGIVKITPHFNFCEDSLESITFAEIGESDCCDITAVENGCCESLVLLFANTNDIQFFVKKVRVLTNFTFFNALIRPFFYQSIISWQNSSSSSEIGNNRGFLNKINLIYLVCRSIRI